ncbi:MAG: cystathionine beta-lyase [Roseitalea sp.]|jgi:cystathionine beta-lyase|nr:cystathionine beta-lyase [Roseitalea sp.]MBO6723140.1 cystathionine beta-lyase [Roseitalea sp.]MBO6744654.1 cystathionine beta-lyase [Roseitalea sp.]
MAGGDTGGKRGINTQLAHSGNDPQAYFGWVNPPVVHGSTVLFPDAATMKATQVRNADAAARSRIQPYTYATYGSPTTDALCEAVDALEGSAGTILVPSGLAAVTVPLLAFLSAGDHVLIVDTVYYPTRRFADTMLARMGVEVDYYAPGRGADIAECFRDNTKVLFMEAPGSNTFEMQDVPALVAAAKAAGIVTMIDNTWATPLFFKPLDHGVDISIHAATKYPGGHSDVVMGMVSANEATWNQLYNTQVALGTCGAPDDAYLVLRGLRTMGIRLERHQTTTLALARWMEALAKEPGSIVGDVLCPALESFPGHAIWKRDFSGAAGLFSFVLKDATEAQAHAFLDALEIFGLGYSWGGYESLVTHVYLKDRTVSARDHGGEVIRLQIGLEDEADLKADIERGLAAATAAG